MQDWSTEDKLKHLFSPLEGPIPQGGVTRRVLLPEHLEQFMLKYLEGRSRHRQELLADGYTYDQLLDTCAGACQVVDMQADRLKALSELLSEWQSTVTESNELTQHTASLLKDVELLMRGQYALGVKDGKSIAPRKGAAKRHTLNRDSKQKVFAWCDENMERFRSMDDAAFDIAETFVPQKFRAVREWMTEWKKLRSASKA